jgi:uncharacterized protein (DUF2147 family)
MKRIGIFLCGLLILGSAFAFADPVEGYWLSVDDKTEKVTAGWHIYQENGKLYGKILSTADHPPGVKAEPCKESYRGFPVPGKVNEMLVTGTPWIFSLSMDKAGQWSGGNIIDPNDGNMYKCKIIYRSRDGKKYKVDTLEMRGEIGLGIGKSQYWQKSNLEEASSLRP